MTGIMSGREALVLAVTLWTALSINDFLLLPGGFLILAPGWISSILLALLLAQVLQRLQNLPRQQAIGLRVLAVIVAAISQAVLDVTAIMTIGPHVLPGGAGVPGFVIADTVDEAMLQLRMSLMWNIVVFGFYAAALSLLNAQRRKLDAEMRALSALPLQHAEFHCRPDRGGIRRAGGPHGAVALALSPDDAHTRSVA